ncbi:MAG TPA: FecR family protein, partial [Opitutaceae bacterium]
MKLRSVVAWSLATFSMASFSFVRAQDAAPAAAASNAVHGSIKIARISGDVFAIDHATGLKTKLSLNSLVADGQTVETEADASVVLAFSNGAVVNVKENSQLSVDEFLQNPFSAAFRMRDAMHEPSVSTTRLDLLRGEIVSQVKKLNRDAGSSFTVETPVGAAGIRGTAFLISFHSEGGSAHFVLSMAEGLIRFLPLHGHPVEVPAGKEVNASASLDGSGKVSGSPEVSTPETISPSSQAILQQSVADVLGAAMNVEFSATSRTSTTGGAPNTNGGTTPQSTDPTASPSTNTDTPTDNPLA